MNFNNFTIKSQEAIQKAVEITKNNGSQAIEPVHLLKAILSEGESLTKFIFAKTGASLPMVDSAVDKEIASQPKVSRSDRTGYSFF